MQPFKFLSTLASFAWFFTVASGNNLAPGQISKRDVPPIPGCRYVANTNRAHNTHCDFEGRIGNPATPITTTSVDPTSQQPVEKQCFRTCQQNKGCKSFAVNTNTNQCTIYPSPLKPMKIKKGKSGIYLYSSSCFKLVCGCEEKSFQIQYGSATPDPTPFDGLYAKLHDYAPPTYNYLSFTSDPTQASTFTLNSTCGMYLPAPSDNTQNVFLSSSPGYVPWVYGFTQPQPDFSEDQWMTFNIDNDGNIEGRTYSTNPVVFYACTSKTDPTTIEAPTGLHQGPGVPDTDNADSYDFGAPCYGLLLSEISIS